MKLRELEMMQKPASRILRTAAASLVVALILLVPCVPIVAATARVEVGAFSILPAQNWTADTTQDGNGAVLKLTYPEDRANMNLVINSVDPNLSLDAFRAAAREKLKELHAEVLSDTVKTIGGREAAMVMVMLESNGVRVKFYQTYFLVNGSVYIVTSGAPASVWEKYRPQFDSMLDSITIK